MVNFACSKADMIAYRNGDRRQFDAITNRVRESSKAHQLLRKDMDERFQEIKETYEHVRADGRVVFNTV
jgi:hypothetical protein